MALFSVPFLSGGAYAVDQKAAEAYLAAALGSGGDFADLFFEYAASASYGYEEGILRSAGRFVGMGVGVRVQHGDATGYAYVEDFVPESILKAAKTASRIAAGGAKAPGAFKVEPRSLPDRYPVPEISLAQPGARKKELLEQADKAARAYDQRITRVEASLSEGVRHILVVSSTGAWAEDTQPMLRFGVRAVAESGETRQSGSSGGGGRVGLDYFDGRSPSWHGEEAARQATVMLDARPAPAGQMEVVLAPGDSGILLHEAVGHGLEADFNRKRTSNYTDRVGEVVASELCTVVDDGALPNSRGSVNVDDEGNIPSRAMLIEKGVLRGYMQDQHSAKFFATEQNGHGRRESFQCAPMPRMTNTLLLEGEDAPEDILKSVKRGVFAKKFGGGQVDISNGDFVFSLTEGYLIEDGKLTSPLKGVNLIGNGPEVMRQVVMLGHDFELSDGIWTCGKDGQSVPVGVGCPTIKLASVTVGGTEL